MKIKHNTLCGFSKFFEDKEETPTFADTVTRDYLNINSYWDGNKYPVTNPLVTLIGSGKRRSLMAGTMVSIDPEYVKRKGREPGKSDMVPVIIGNEAGEAHGKENKYAGEKFTVPYSSFLWMIQPPDPAAGAAPGMPPGGGPTGMPGI